MIMSGEKREGPTKEYIYFLIYLICELRSLGLNRNGIAVLMRN